MMNGLSQLSIHYSPLETSQTPRPTRDDPPARRHAHAKLGRRRFARRTLHAARRHRPRRRRGLPSQRPHRRRRTPPAPAVGGYLRGCLDFCFLVPTVFRGNARQGALRPRLAVLQRRAFRVWVPRQSMGTSIGWGYGTFLMANSEWIIENDEWSFSFTIRH